MPPLPIQTKKLIAHRGGVVDAHRSENSFKALEEAIARGYTHVEIDARITADGHAICFHNDDLQEEAGIEGKISELPLEKVTQTTLTRSGETIPTFEDYCAHCAGRMGVMIDLKGCKTQFIDSYAHEIETALKKHNLLDDALILINKIPINNQAQIAQRFAEKTKVSWRQSLLETQQTVELNPNFAKEHYIFNHADDFTDETINGFHDLGLEVIVSINTYHYKTGDPQKQGEHHLQKMLQFGADGLQIDSCYDIALHQSS
jgi:glycerophosphoryl diester phosphodiesterase